MTKKLNTFASDLATDYPISNKDSIYLIQSSIRKDVEHAEWLISLKQKDIDLLDADMVYVTSCNIKHETMQELSGSTVKLVTAKYGAVIGAPHYNEDLHLDLEERKLEREVAIEMIQGRIKKMKEAFKQLTGDTFTPYKKKAAPVQQSTADRRAALEAARAKLAS